MDEFVTAIEYDHEGNLWIGYSRGIQIFNGVNYQTIRDQQLFKDPRIQDIRRWHDDMWVSTGNSGIHRYRNGVWTWFQPMAKNGPGFYEIREMALDPAGDSLIITTYDNGTWIIRSLEDPVVFEQIAAKDGSYPSLHYVRRDPHGGCISSMIQP
jgi:tripartite motif-containing protein 71